MSIQRFFLSSLFWLLTLSGCAVFEENPSVRYFWPPSEADAKIEYLNFIASEENLKVERFSNILDIVFGVERAKQIFVSPFAVDALDEFVVVTDPGNAKLVVLNKNKNAITTVSLATVEKRGAFPVGVAIISREELLVADAVSQKVSRYSFEGEYLGDFGSGHFSRPVGIGVDRKHGLVAIADVVNHRVAIFGLDGAFRGHVGALGSAPGKFNFPLDVDFDVEGDLFVLDSMNFRVQRFKWDGGSFQFVLSFGELGTALGAFSRPKALAVSGSGHVYVTDALAHKVVVFDRDGRFLLTFGRKFLATNGNFAPGGLYMPRGIAADARDNIWVVDSLNRMLHHFQYLNDEYLRANPIIPGQLAPSVLQKE